LIPKVDGNSVNIVSWQIRLENPEAREGFGRDSAAAWFFLWRLRINERHGMSVPREKDRSPRAGGARTNDGYLHEYLNIER